jgi:uncharacterized membrane protein YdjX (TVP38/TMEM64 family)
MKSKKIIPLIFFFILISFSVFFIFEYSKVIQFTEKTFLFILSLKNQNLIEFIFFIILLNFIYFLTPLPVTIILLFNGFILGFIGFLFSAFFLSIGIILTFLFSHYFLKNNFSNFSFFNPLNSKIKKYKFIKKPNNLSIFFSRFLIPFFFNNIIFGLYNSVTLKRFYIISFLAELPAAFAYNSIGMSLSSFVLQSDYKIKDLFVDINFLIPLLLVFLIIFVSSYVKKKYI